jgi:hypothetical protein
MLMKTSAPNADGSSTPHPEVRSPELKGASMGGPRSRLLGATAFTGVNSPPLAHGPAPAPKREASKPPGELPGYEQFQLGPYQPPPVQGPPVPPKVEELEKPWRRRKPSNLRYQDRRLPDGRLERIATARPGFKIISFVYTFDENDPSVSGRTIRLVTQKVRRVARPRKRDDSDVD